MGMSRTIISVLSVGLSLVVTDLTSRSPSPVRPTAVPLPICSSEPLTSAYDLWGVYR